MPAFLSPHFSGNCLFRRVVWLHSSSPVAGVSNSRPLGETRLGRSSWLGAGLCRACEPSAERWLGDMTLLWDRARLHVWEEAGSTECDSWVAVASLQILVQAQRGPSILLRALPIPTRLWGVQSRISFHIATASNRSFLKSVGWRVSISSELHAELSKGLIMAREFLCSQLPNASRPCVLYPNIPLYLMSDVLIQLCNTPDACSSH